MEKVTITDLINYAYEDNPSKIQSSFDSIIADKIQSSLQQKKIEIANSLFNTDQEVEDEEQVEDEEVESDEENSETEEEESE